MKTKPSLFCIATAGLLTATTALWNALPAQGQTQFPIVPAQSSDDPAPIEIEPQERKTATIPLKNVKPQSMLSWLCPSMPSKPTDSTPKTSNRYTVRGSSHDYKILDYSQHPALTFASPPAFPEGITSIVADDAKNALIVVGTEEAIKKLENTIRFLDRPLRSVELETHVVPFREAEFQAFGLDFDAPTSTPKGTVKLRGNLSTVLESRALVGPMSEIKVPRTSVLNNLTSKFDAFRSSPVSPLIKDLLTQATPQADASTAPLENQTVLKFEVTPTLNLDNTVTLLANITARQQVGRKGSTAPVLSGTSSDIQSVINLRDSETIAIRLFDPTFTSAFEQHQSAKNPPITSLFKSRKPLKPNPGEELVVFLTPHITHN